MGFRECFHSFAHRINSRNYMQTGVVFGRKECLSSLQKSLQGRKISHVSRGPSSFLWTVSESGFRGLSNSAGSLSIVTVEKQPCRAIHGSTNLEATDLSVKVETRIAPGQLGNPYAHGTTWVQPCDGAEESPIPVWKRWKRPLDVVKL